MAASACTPSDTSESGIELQEVAEDQSSSIQGYLQRLEEPLLSEDCSEELTSYRFLKLDTDDRVASVRVLLAEDEESYSGAYRSAFSASPGMSISSDGYLDERMWKRIEAEFGFSDFWNLESERDIAELNEPSFFLEACKNGEYHWLKRRLRDNWLARIVKIFTIVGKLKWLETGR